MSEEEKNVLAFIKIIDSGTTSSFTAGDPKSNNNTNITVADTSWANMRWQPISTDDDNCLPGFQLANATIHCGVNDLSPITKDSDGSEYCGGVKMEPNFCVMPINGTWADRVGEQLPGRFGVHNSRDLPRCKTMESFVNGSFVETGEWIPEICSAVPLSPFAWTEDAACQTTISMLVSIHSKALRA